MVGASIGVGSGQLLWERLEFYFAISLNAFFIFSSTQLCVLRPFTVMKKKKRKTRLKLLQNKIPNAPIRVGLRFGISSEIWISRVVDFVPVSYTHLTLPTKA